MIRIHIDQDKCVGSGQCVMTLPEVFDQREEDGVVVLLRDRAGDALEASLRKAAKLCPARVISLEEE